ncbi:MULTISPECIES: hypothetical protein [Providencia]|uniref:hypothetical protein n=1 Tax=Providencia TaxID=586 RepID=UPI00155F244E|nr:MULTISPECIES: hypothetical protein [Providencia]MBG5922559.1 hypothetical protein [Providencia rettgeri]QKG45331.1 hypothetical protein HRD55_12345 [Providencia rettgeri]QNN31567.1 hypothetical protein H9X60_12345 [Providencia rettgeri]HEM8210037.1 hypothetical protein [Providencia rettgeri]
MNKRDIELLLDAPRMKTKCLMTLLTVWLDAESDEETANMISIVMNTANGILNDIESATEGK